MRGVLDPANVRILILIVALPRFIVPLILSYFSYFFFNPLHVGRTGLLCISSWETCFSWWIGPGQSHVKYIRANHEEWPI